MAYPAVKVTGLGKQYYLNALLKSSSVIGRLTNSENSPHKTDTFWALKDISFELEKGDVLGIIGANGSGKSTLLKVLSEIVSPTTGTIEMRGRVASILEIGTGFHPDLTGRENIFFSGSLLGISTKRLKERFDEIVAFSGIAEFIDTPVKHYSSGMYLRLATAIVFHVDADVLLLDEILSAGDAEFKLKTLHKMESASGTGTTIIMVSHNMNEVMKLCNKCMILAQGKMEAFGNPAQNISKYLDQAVQKSEAAETELTKVHKGYIRTWHNASDAPGDELVRIKKISIQAQGKPLEAPMYMEDTLLVEIEYWKLQQGMSIEMLLVFYDKLEAPVFATSLVWNKGDEILYGRHIDETGVFKATCQIPANLLYKGRYSFQLTFGRDTTLNNINILFNYRENFHFTVEANPERGDHKFLDEMPIALRPHHTWKLEKI